MHLRAIRGSKNYMHTEQHSNFKPYLCDMKKISALFLTLALAVGCTTDSRASLPADGELQLSDIVYSQTDSARVVELLSKQLPANENDVLFFARSFLGLPYVAHTLEIADPEKLVVNLHGLDCTTYVETVLALTLTHRAGSTDFMDFCRNLERLRYRGGKMDGYLSRLHYFAWWMHDNINLGIVSEVTDAKYFTAPMHVNDYYMTQHPDSYKMLKAHPEWVSRITAMEKAANGKDGTYLPKSRMLLTRSQLPVRDGDVIAIVTQKAGLDYSHLGFSVWGKDGKLHLLNASALYHKVVEDNNTFHTYLQRQKSALGARFFRLR